MLFRKTRSDYNRWSITLIWDFKKLDTHLDSRANRKINSCQFKFGKNWWKMRPIFLCLEGSRSWASTHIQHRLSYIPVVSALCWGSLGNAVVTGPSLSMCLTQVEATRRIMLEKLPVVLVLHLKCFVYDKSGGCQKITNKQIEFPVHLDIGNGGYSFVFAHCAPHFADCCHVLFARLHFVQLKSFTNHHRSFLTDTMPNYSSFVVFLLNLTIDLRMLRTIALKQTGSRLLSQNYIFIVVRNCG